MSFFDLKFTDRWIETPRKYLKRKDGYFSKKLRAIDNYSSQKQLFRVRYKLDT